MSGDSMERCATCEVKDFGGEGELIPVWEDPADYKRAESPDYLGCTECNTMRSVDSETEVSK